MRKRHQTESVVQHEGASQSETQSVLTQDELLIELVRTRRGLWDHSIPITERTRLKKESLWQEIVNAFDGSLSMETVKQRWKHLRDSYIKARKKMQGYVRSGSGAESGHPLRSSFAHYEEMRFLDDTVKTTPTVSSVQHLLEANSSHVEDMQVDMTAENSTDLDDSIQGVSYSPSDSSQSALSGTKRKNVQRQAEIENKFLSIIDEVSSKKRDVVDSFLDQLGDILRRLSYVRRRNLQRRLMDIAIEEEDAELGERASAK
ncbi:uncharacterized protein LOC105280836 isoform X1 [Ooceraea biroi]|uniref:uncharacterized protein LOC105280836 isoform X1 n=1 Tax=Ooceraea biroi TaxID=2015173 RepID=UPI0005B8AA2E|nr:uncharacterized protein LOC105280836 isoform X1 [Ooceraea biroi]XP_019887690.1 uncharacterized protein LOC105280836 isoform X1 [Ooceraea biroi]XP_019887691.1 uncharacterized protein LOC105280836 isoform X1 [Ooceraea biroi]